MAFGMPPLHQRMTSAGELGRRVLAAACPPGGVRDTCLGALAAPGHLLSDHPTWATLFLTWSDALGAVPTEALLPAAVACEFLAAGFDLLDAADDQRSAGADASPETQPAGMMLLLLDQELIGRVAVPAERKVLAGKILARASRRVLAAQVQDVALRGQARADPETVLAILRRRSGTLAAAPCQGAVALHGGSWRALALAGRFGQALGGAAQLEDDLADLAADAAGGRHTVPTVLAALHPTEPELVTATTWVLNQRCLREAALVLDRLSPHCRRPEVLWTLLPPA